MSSGLVKVSDLKNRLSHYLRQVRGGATLLVCDRDRVIARLEPAGGADLAADGDAQWLADLERRGTIRRAVAPLARTWLARRPEAGKKGKRRTDVVAALLAERDEGR